MSFLFAQQIPFKTLPFPSWRGEILNKQEILCKSRFSIVYENVQGVKGYITEKIFDASWSKYESMLKSKNALEQFNKIQSTITSEVK